MDEKILEKGNELKAKIHYTEESLEFVKEELVKNTKNANLRDVLISGRFESKGHMYHTDGTINLNKEEFISLLGELELILLQKLNNYKKEFEEL